MLKLHDFCNRALALGPVALSFVGATDKESIATIKALEASYGPAWVNEWLSIRGVPTSINVGRTAAAPNTSEKLHESV